MVRTLAAVSFLALAGCLPSDGLRRLEAFDRAAEGESDQVLAAIIKHWCSAPADMIARQAATSPYIAQGMYLMCPPVRSLVDSVNLAIGR